MQELALYIKLAGPFKVLSSFKNILESDKI
jgi:hypothetical protein